MVKKELTFFPLSNIIIGLNPIISVELWKRIGIHACKDVVRL